MLGFRPVTASHLYEFADVRTAEPPHQNMPTSFGIGGILQPDSAPHAHVIMRSADVQEDPTGDQLFSP